MKLGSVGIVNGQGARVSLFPHADPKFTGGPYRVDILGDDGKLLATQEGSLAPGAGAALDWGDGFPGFPNLRRGDRLQVHVDVHVGDPDIVGSTVEIFDRKTGETQWPIDPCIMPLPITG